VSTAIFGPDPDNCPKVQRTPLPARGPHPW
jgi:hypothetical protein